MHCDELESVLHPYLDGEFETPERLDVEAHLAGCRACAGTVHEEARFRESLRQTLFGEDAARPAPDSLRSRIRVGIQQEVRAHRRRRVLRMSAAAAMVVCLGGAAWSLQPDPQRPYVDDAARRHARGLPFEIELSSPEHVEAWFDGKLDHRVPVPEFPDLAVSGARLANVRDRPAAYITYEDRKAESRRRVGLFVFTDTDGKLTNQQAPGVEVDTSHGYNVALWRDGEIVYELVSDLDAEDIRRLVSNKKLGRARAPALATADRSGGEERTAQRAVETVSDPNAPLLFTPPAMSHPQLQVRPVSMQSPPR